MKKHFFLRAKLLVFFFFVHHCILVYSVNLLLFFFICLIIRFQCNYIVCTVSVLPVLKFRASDGIIFSYYVAGFYY